MSESKVWRIEKHRQGALLPGLNTQHHSETEWVRLWVEYLREDDVPFEQFVAVHGCVCHNPGPFDPYFRQPRLMRYCTCKGCDQPALYAVWPLTRPPEFACVKHLEHMRRFFPSQLVWCDARGSTDEEPEWRPYADVYVA